MSTTSRTWTSSKRTRSENTAAGLHLAAPLLFAALALGPAPATWASDTGSADQAVEEAQKELLEAARALLAPLGTKSGPEPGIVAARLAALGPEAIPTLFEIASNGFAGPGGDERREAVHGAFRRLPANLVLAHLRSVGTGDAGLAPRLRAMEIIGVAGAAGAFPVLLEITGGITSRQFKSQAVVARLRPALTSLLQADTRRYRSLERGWDAHEPAMREIALDAIESIGRRSSLRSLGRLLGKDEATNLSVLRRLGRLPVTGPDELGDGALFEIESLLGNENAAVRRAAAHLVGRYRHLAALDKLMLRLDDDDRGVRATAAGSLRQITGLSLGDGEAERWRAWIKEERRWHSTEYPGQRRKLRDTNPEVRLGTLGSLASHRLHAEAIWRDVAGGLDDSDPAIRVAACTTLGSLRARSALARLVEALADPEPEVVLAAEAALAECTGRPSAGDAAAWTSLLDLDPGNWD